MSNRAAQLDAKPLSRVSESSNSSGTLFKLGATNKQAFEDRILKAMGKIQNTVCDKVAKFKTRMTLIEVKRAEHQLTPSISAVGNRGPGLWVTSPLTSSVSFSLSK